MQMDDFRFRSTKKEMASSLTVGSGLNTTMN
jgi:hypothetical protein